MKKVKLKLDQQKAKALILILENGTVSFDDNSMLLLIALLGHEVIHKLKIATVYMPKPKTFTFTLAQATVITFIDNPYPNDPYFAHVVSMPIKQEILKQIS